jgi:hypothetical protein
MRNKLSINKTKEGIYSANFLVSSQVGYEPKNSFNISNFPDLSSALTCEQELIEEGFYLELDLETSGLLQEENKAVHSLVNILKHASLVYRSAEYLSHYD